MSQSSSALPAPNDTQQVKPGVYTMRAIDADLAMTKGSSTDPPRPQVAVLMEFSDGIYVGQSITWYGYFTEKTKQSTLKSLRTLGWKGNDVSDLSSVRGEAPCTISSEPDLDGVVHARVRFIGGGALAVSNVMSTEQKLAFAESMKAFAASISTPVAKSNGAQATLGDTTERKKFF